MERMSPQIDKLLSALVKTQFEMKVAPKDSDNPFFKSKYADLQTVWETIKQPLGNNGLCVIQFPIEAGEDSQLITILGHETGQYIASETPIKIKSKVTKVTKEGVTYEVNLTPQEVAAQVTYFRRMCVSAITGCYTGEADDDGETIEGRSNSAVSSSPKEERKPIEKKESSSNGKISQKQAEWLLKELNILNDGDHFKQILSTYGIKEIPDLRWQDFAVVMEGVKEKQKNKSRVA